MHEISIMEGALELAEEHARKAGGTAIRRICLQVGFVSGVVPEALEFAFDALKVNTMAENASLEIARIPGEFRCSKCGIHLLLAKVRFDCPECDGMLILNKGGAELELSHLEIS
jgi:hydrogenase nickel incorporation protein HypA/HybF